MTKEIFDFYKDIGIDEVTSPKAIDRTVQPKRVEPKTKPTKKASKAPIESLSPIQEAELLVKDITSLDALKKAVHEFNGCDLKKTATSTVFSDGQSDASIMLIGEAPGADEDIQGKPFVGRSGQLLDRIFAEIGLSREKNTYISNILFWRPPGNRTPTRSEISICRPFVLKHIELVQPKVIILVGGTALKGLLQTSSGIMKMRGQFTEFGPNNIPVLPIYHPAFLLRSPGQKRFVWKDMLLLKDKIKELKIKI